MRYPVFFAITAGIAIAACDATPGQPPAAATTAAAAHPQAKDGLIPGTPAGDLDTWVREMRSGIAAIPATARNDAAAAQRAALDLYVTRQEYAEMYYGVDGRIRGAAELPNAIETAEERFHALLRLLTTPNPPADAIQEAVDALDLQQARVMSLWRQSGLRLPRPAVQ